VGDYGNGNSRSRMRQHARFGNKQVVSGRKYDRGVRAGAYAGDEQRRTIDVNRARAETLGCQHVHDFDNAGCALPPGSVLEAAQGHLVRKAEIGGDEAAAEAEGHVEHTYDAQSDVNAANEQYSVLPLD